MKKARKSNTNFKFLVNEIEGKKINLFLIDKKENLFLLFDFCTLTQSCYKLFKIDSLLKNNKFDDFEFFLRDKIF